jgi:uroporphyrinogen decarboxylase
MLTALRRSEPDTVPVWELLIDHAVIEALHGDISTEDLVELEGLDGITVVTDSKKTWLDSGTYRDEWGITWRVGEYGIGYPSDGPVKLEKDLETYHPPDPDADYRYKSAARVVDRFKGEKAIVFLGHEAFEYSWLLMGGMTGLFINYIENPDFARQLAEVVWSYQGRLLENMAQLGVDILLTADDYAGGTGPLVSPNHFREFILPYLQKSVDVAHQNGLPFIKHTDGNLWKILDMIVDTGIDGLHPNEPMAGMDIGEVKARYGHRIAVLGNVDCAVLLTEGSRDEVIEAVKETIAKASHDGGHVLSSSNSIHPAVKASNFATMVAAARKHGEYPLDPGLASYKSKNYIARYRDPQETRAQTEVGPPAA